MEIWQFKLTESDWLHYTHNCKYKITASFRCASSAGQWWRWWSRWWTPSEFSLGLINMVAPEDYEGTAGSAYMYVITKRRPRPLVKTSGELRDRSGKSGRVVHLRYTNYRNRPTEPLHLWPEPESVFAIRMITFTEIVVGSLNNAYRRNRSSGETVRASTKMPNLFMTSKKVLQLY